VRAQKEKKKDGIPRITPVVKEEGLLSYLLKEGGVEVLKGERVRKERGPGRKGRIEGREAHGISTIKG